MRHLTIGILLLWMSLAGAVQAAESFVTEAFINAPTEEVWRIFTAPEGAKAAVAQPAADLRIGGEIRSYYDPGLLSEGEAIISEILAYEPERMLAIRVKQAPASLPHRAALAGTWTVLYFNSAGEGMTQVRVVGLGYKGSNESQALREFFAEANRRTLDRIARQYWPKCALCEKGGAQ